MLLEQLVEKAGQTPEYDWKAYYRWLFGELAGREVDGYASWLCPQCCTVNIVQLPARYGTCRGCNLSHLAGDPIGG